MKKYRRLIASQSCIEKGKRMAALFLALVLVAGTVGVMAPANRLEAEAAVDATKDNPVLFKVQGGMTAGNVQYNIIVESVFAGQNYLSFNIIYPNELELVIPASIGTVTNAATGAGSGSVWSFSKSKIATTTTHTFIVKAQTGLDAGTLKNGIESLSFKLADPSGKKFPPENSKVAISAAPTKVTSYIDTDGYVHYYEYVKGQKNWTDAYNDAHNKTMQDPRYPDQPDKRLYGYLATVTSQLEQRKVYSDIATECGWLAGTRMLYGTAPTGYTNKAGKKIQDEGSKQPGSANTGNIPNTISATTYNTGTTSDKWYWADGPEAWTVYNSTRAKYTYYPFGMATVPGDAWVIRDKDGNDIYAGQSSGKPNINLPEGSTLIEDPNRGIAVTPLIFYNKITNAAAPAGDGAPAGVYANWNNPYGVNVDGAVGTGAEPNNSNTEYVTQFAYTGKDLWNDFAQTPSTTVLGYYVEYGGYPDDPKAEDLGGSGIETSSEVTLNMPILYSYRSTVKEMGENKEEDYREITSIVKNWDGMKNYELSLPYTVERRPDPILGYTPYGYAFEGDQEDKDNLTVQPDGSVDGFHSTHYQYITFLYKPNDVTVSFDPNFQGSNSASVSSLSKVVQFDTPYGVLATAQRSGYRFTGWYTQASGGDLVTDSTLAPMENHTLYAQWEPRTDFKVNYDLNDGYGTPPYPKVGVAWGDSDLLLPLNLTTFGDQVFTGWDVSVNGTKQGVKSTDTYSSLANSDAVDSITLQAQWRSAEYIWVIYHLNGGTASGLVDTRFESGDPVVSLPSAARPGYTFEGWAITEGAKSGTQGLYPADTMGLKYTDLAEKNEKGAFIVVEAQWTPMAYTVHYDSQGASSGEISDKENVLWNENGLTPPAGGNPTKDNHTFMGWYTQANGEGTPANTGTAYGLLAGSDQEEEITLYAKWQADRTYFVQYDTNGGTPSTIANKTGVFIGETNLLPDTAPTPPVGHSFAGWSVTYNGSKTGVSESDRFGDLAADPNAGYIVLQAQYSPKSRFKVNYNLNGGTVPAGTTIPASKGAGNVAIDHPEYSSILWTQSNLLPLANPTNSASTFMGWNTSQDGTGRQAAPSDTYGDLAVGAVQGAEPAEITLYAQWVANTLYTVRYDLNGGTVGTEPIATQTISNNPPAQKVNLPTPLPPQGYVFDHWEVKDNGYGQRNVAALAKDEFGKSVKAFTELVYGEGTTESPYRKYIELCAIYIERRDFSVDFNWNFEGAPEADTVSRLSWTGSAPTSALLPHTAKRPGFNLLGWTLDQAGATKYILPGVAYRELVSSAADPKPTLYAQWEEASFTVKYDLAGIAPPTGVDWKNEISVGFDDDDLIPKQELNRVGYNLVGWKVSEYGIKAENITSVDSFHTLASAGAPYITLQAQWGPKNYVVNYDLNDAVDTTVGTQADPHTIPSTPASGTGAKGWDSTDLLPSDPKRPGYTFVGWKASYIGTIPVGTAEIEKNPVLASDVDKNTKYAALAMLDGMDYGNITLQAQWMEDTNKLMFDFVPVSLTYGYEKINEATKGGAVSPAGSTSFAPASENVTSTATAKPGFDFVGWFTSDIDKISDPSDISGFIDEKAGYNLTDPSKLTYTNPRDSDGRNVQKPDSAFRAVFREQENIDLHFKTATYKNDAITPISHPSGNLGGTIGQAANSSKTQDTLSIAPATGLPVINAYAKPGYVFAGWYEYNATSEFNYLTDEKAEQLADTDAAQKPLPLLFAPGKTGGDLNGVKTTYEDGKTYVAVFYEAGNVDIEYGVLTLNQDGTVQNISEGSSQGGKFTIGVFGGTPSALVDGATDTLTPATEQAREVKAASAAGYEFMGWYRQSDLNGAGDPAKPIEGVSSTIENVSSNYDEGAGSGKEYFQPGRVGQVNVAETYVAVFQEKEAVTITYAPISLDNTAGRNVQPTGNGGAVDPETNSAVPATGTMDGATAAANPGYTFIGWYGEDAFEVEGETDTKIGLKASSARLDTPIDTGVPEVYSGFFGPIKPNPIWAAARYYAVFEEDADVEITFGTRTFGSGWSDQNTPANQGGIVTNSGAKSYAPATGAPTSTATANSGYTLVGWFLEGGNYENLTAISTANKFDPSKNTTSGVLEDRSYVAVFKEDSDVEINFETFTYDNTGVKQGANKGGTIDQKSTNLYAPVTAAPSSQATANPGYTLVGWFEKTGPEVYVGTGLPHTDGQLEPAREINGLNIGGKTYVAVFKENDSVQITFGTKTFGNTWVAQTTDVDMGGTVVTPNATNLYAPATGVPTSTATAKDGYTFVGWFEDAAGTDYERDTPIEEELTFSPEKDEDDDVHVTKSYVAVFKEKPSVAITFETKTFGNDGEEQKTPADMGGTVSPAGTASYAPATGKPLSEATAKDGYTFKGWYEASSNPDFKYLENEEAGRKSTANEFEPEKEDAASSTPNVYVEKSYVAVFQEDASVEISFGIKTYGSDGTPQTGPEHVGGRVSTAGGPYPPATGVPTSTATAYPGYRFIGWYEENNASDFDYLDDPEVGRKTTDHQFDPEKAASPDANVHVAKSYVAVFQETDGVEITFETKTFGSGWAEQDTDPDMGGTVDTPNPTNLYAPATGVPTSTATAKDGYTFVGWFAEGDDYDSDTPIKDELTFSPEKDEDDDVHVAKSYVAVFRENASVAITFGTQSFGNDWAEQATEENMGGKVTNPGVAYHAPATGTPTSEATAKAGYTFLGWFEAGADYESDTPIVTTASFSPAKATNPNVHVEKSYVAVFRENTSVAISFETKTFGNDGAEQKTSADMGGTVSSAGGSYPPATGIPTSKAEANAGYTFLGWFVDGADFENDTPITTAAEFDPAKDGTTNVHVAKSYVAVFKEDPSVAITFGTETFSSLWAEQTTGADMGGTVTNPGTASYAPATGTPNSEAKANVGYTFVGWFESGVDYRNTTPISTVEAFRPAKATGSNVHVEKSYVAVFKENSDVEISYETFTYGNDDVKQEANQGGTVSPNETNRYAPVTVEPFSQATASPGYTLVGWFEKSPSEAYPGVGLSHTGGLLKPEKVGGLNIGDRTYVAVFKEDRSIEITFETKTFGSGWVEQDTDPDMGGTVSTPNNTNLYAPATGNPTSTATAKDGYTFVGWFVEGDDYDSDAPIEEELTFSPEKDEDDDVHVAESYVAVFQENASVAITFGTQSFGNDWTEQTTSANMGGTVTNQGTAYHAPATGTPTSTATAKAGYTFLGWFEAGADYESDTPIVTTASFSPAKATGSNVYVANSYVAVFKENTSVAISFETKTFGNDWTEQDTSADMGGTVSSDGGSYAPATGRPTSTASAKAGYNFVGWYVDGADFENDAAIVNTGAFSPAKDGATGVHVANAYVAVFQETSPVPITFAVRTFSNLAAAQDNALGGTVTPNGTADHAPATGAPVSVASAKIGYTFIGWYEENTTPGFNYLTDDGAVFKSDDLKFAPQKEEASQIHMERSYVAVFQEDGDATITFGVKTYSNGNTWTLQGENLGGIVTPSGDSGHAPSTGTPSSTAQASDGYKFMGWFRSDVEITNDASYAAATKLEDAFLFEPQKDVAAGKHLDGSYVAVFKERDDVAITFATKTIDYSGAPQADTLGGTVDAGGSYAPATGKPESSAAANPGYDFVGWYAAMDITFATKLSGANPVLAPAVNAQGLNEAGAYVALFQEKENVTITFATKTFGSGWADQADGLGGSVTKAGGKLYGPASGTPKSTAISTAGYHFMGWFKAGADYKNNKPLEASTLFKPAKDGKDGVLKDQDFVAVFKEDGDIDIRYETKTYGNNSLVQSANLGGTVDPQGLVSYAPVTKEPSSQATANAGYTLVGWFEKTAAENYILPILVHDKGLFKPEKIGGLNTQNTYVAVFKEKADEIITFATKTFGSDWTAQDSVQDIGGSLTTVAGTSENGTGYAPATGMPKSTAMEKAGYDFAGWFDSKDVPSDGGQLDVSKRLDKQVAGSMQYDGSFVPERNSDKLNVSGSYIAVFVEEADVKITFTRITLGNDGSRQDSVNGGAVSPSDEKSYAPVTETPSASSTVHTGYYLAGWYDSKDVPSDGTLPDASKRLDKKVNGSDDYNGQFQPERNEEGLNLAATYVAVFVEEGDVEIRYSTHNVNPEDNNPGGSIQPFETQYHAPMTGGANTPVATAAKGYHFVGWYVENAQNLYNGEPSIKANQLSLTRYADGRILQQNYVAVFEEDEPIQVSYVLFDKSTGLPGGGTINRYHDEALPVTGSFAGATATATSDHYFVGWFLKNQANNYDGTVAAPISTATTFVPAQVNGLFTANTYVAVFAQKTNTQKLETAIYLTVSPEDEQVFGEKILLTATMSDSVEKYADAATITFYEYDEDAHLWREIEKLAKKYVDKGDNTASFLYLPDHVGSGKYKAEFSGDSKHKSSVSAEVVCNILPAPADIVIDSMEDTVYNGAKHPGPVINADVPYELEYVGIGSTVYGPSTTPPTNAGEYEVIAKITDPNYVKSEVKEVFTIAPRLPFMDVNVSVQEGEVDDEGYETVLEMEDPTADPSDPATKWVEKPVLIDPAGDPDDESNWKRKKKMVTNGTITADVSSLVGTDEPKGTVTFHIDTDGDGVADLVIADVPVKKTPDGKYQAITDGWQDISDGGHNIVAEYVPAPGENYGSGTAHKDAYDAKKADQTGFAGSVIRKTYGDSAFAVSAGGGASTGPITYELVSGGEFVDFDPSTGTVSIKGAGTAVIRAKHAGDANFNDAYANITVIIEKAANAITQIVVPQIKAREDFVPEVTVDGGNITYVYEGNLADGSHYGPSEIPPTEPGDYTMDIIVAPSENYEGITQEDIPFTIVPCECNIAITIFEGANIEIGYYKLKGTKALVSGYELTTGKNHGQSLEWKYSLADGQIGAEIVLVDGVETLVVNDLAVGTTIPVTVTYTHIPTGKTATATVDFTVTKAAKPADPAVPTTPPVTDPDNPSLDPGSSSDGNDYYDKNNGGNISIDISTLVDQGNAEISLQILNNAKPLEEGKDYRFEEGELVFDESFLLGLKAGEENKVEIISNKWGRKEFYFNIYARKGKLDVKEVNNLVPDSGLSDPDLPKIVGTPIPEEELINLLPLIFSEEELAEITGQMEEGYDIHVKLVIEELLVTDDAAMIAEAAGLEEREIGFMIDLSLQTWVGNEVDQDGNPVDPAYIKELPAGKTITIECEIPEAYRGHDFYWVGMVHHPSGGGEPEFRWIPAEVFANGTMFRFEVDRFSTVAITYKDKVVVPPAPPTNPAGPNPPDGNNPPVVEEGNPTGPEGGGGDAGVTGTVVSTPGTAAGGAATAGGTTGAGTTPAAGDGAIVDEVTIAEDTDPDMDTDGDILGLDPDGAENADPELEGETEPVAELIPAKLPIVQWILNGLLGLFAIAGAGMILSSGARAGVLSAIKGAMGYMPKGGSGTYAQSVSSVADAATPTANGAIAGGKDTSWIRIAGTDIDYPIAMDGEMEEHLYAKLAGGTASDGIYMDNRCSDGLDSPFLLFYGNNNEDGSMFAALNDYLEEGYLEEHPTVSIAKAYEEAQPYQILAAYITTVSDEAFDLVNKSLEEVVEYFTEQGINLPEDAGQVVGMSTWTNSDVTNERLLVLAAKTE